MVRSLVALVVAALAAAAGAGCGPAAAVDRAPVAPPPAAPPADAPVPRGPLATVLQDDARVLHRTDAQVRRNLRAMRRAGVSTLRVTALWMELAPRGRSTRRPRGFAADRPRGYAGDAVDRLDRAVRLARRAGLRVMLDLGFWAPLWATDDRRGDLRGVTRPDPRAFARFARAMGRRYSGRFRPRRGAPRLPRVGTFTLWNEPNHPGFLQPQDGDAAADHYRAMVAAAYPALKGVRDDATVLVGATSSTGNDTGVRVRSTPPLRFLRRLACVDEDLRPVTDGACRDFHAVPGDGWSHHPYALERRPSEPSPPDRPDDAGIGDLPRLLGLLDRLATAGRVAPALRDVWLTEFGYETNDRVRGKPWTPAEQARLLPAAEWVAWSFPRVRSTAQFLLRDIETAAARRLARTAPGRRAPGSWQTGLLREDGSRKPAWAAFRLALVPLPADSRLAAAGGPVAAPGGGPAALRFWGRVRPARRPVEARLEVLDGDAWRVVPTRPAAGAPTARAVPSFATAGDGTFLRVTQGEWSGGHAWRVAWHRAPGRWEAGPAVAGP